MKSSQAQLWDNPVKKILKEGKPVIAGTGSPSPALKWLPPMANMGFDLLWIKMDGQARARRRGARSNLSLHSTPDLAKQAAASTKYPPCGRRSSGSGLPSFRWLGPESYADFAGRNVLTTIIIIEEKRALEKTDALFVGANDLSYSYGKRVDMLGGGAAPLLKALGKEGVDPKKAPLY